MKRWLRRGLVFTAVSVFCALFGGVYEIFSHGVYSYGMIYAFMFPLCLGALPCMVMALFSRPCKSSVSFDLYVFAIAFASAGCAVSGVLEIYGTTSSLAVVFPIAAAVLFVLAIVTAVISAVKSKNNTH